MNPVRLTFKGHTVYVYLDFDGSCQRVQAANGLNLIHGLTLLERARLADRAQKALGWELDV